VEFALSWDSPDAIWGTGKILKRRHSTFFQSSHSKLNSASLCSIALSQGDSWEKIINEWQKPILGDGTLPKWFKPMVFNELYVGCENENEEQRDKCDCYASSLSVLLSIL